MKRNDNILHSISLRRQALCSPPLSSTPLPLPPTTFAIKVRITGGTEIGLEIRETPLFRTKKYTIIIIYQKTY